MKFKSAMDDEEEEEEDEDDEPVCPSAFLKTTTKTMGGGRGGGLGRAKVLANTTPSGAQQQRQRQQQHHQRAFHPSRPPFHHSNNNNNNISNSNNNTSAKTHSRLHNSFVANSSRLEVAAVRDDERRITKRNQNGKRKETEETRGQDWRISNPSDAEELLEKKREAYLNMDPEVARERRMLKERFSGKSVANTANTINNNNDNNNQKENNQRRRRRERNTLPSKYEHLALVFNGLKMYRELLRMRNSAETVENICGVRAKLSQKRRAL